MFKVRVKLGIVEAFVEAFVLVLIVVVVKVIFIKIDRTRVFLQRSDFFQKTVPTRLITVITIHKYKQIHYTINS